MRLFIALHLNIPLLNAIEKFISPYRQMYKEVKWAYVENLHLTLKFLGETPEEQLENISSSLKKIERSNFTLAIQRIGAFPNLKTPKVVWIGVEGDVEAMSNLFYDVEKEMVNLNFPKEKRDFSPHLTIGRVKKIIPAQLIEELYKNQDISCGEVNIKHFSLIQSQLTKKGAVYRVIKEYPLKT